MYKNNGPIRAASPDTPTPPGSHEPTVEATTCRSPGSLDWPGFIFVAVKGRKKFKSRRADGEGGGEHDLRRKPARSPSRRRGRGRMGGHGSGGGQRLFLATRAVCSSRTCFRISLQARTASPLSALGSISEDEFIIVSLALVKVPSSARLKCQTWPLGRCLRESGEGPDGSTSGTNEKSPKSKGHLSVDCVTAIAPEIATRIATGLLTTRWYAVARRKACHIEISDKIRCARTTRNSLVC
jgi:hypothetical protein